jgi:hypothetical protein
MTLVPDPDNGVTVSSWIASMYSFTNVSRFFKITTAKMITIQEVIESQPQSIRKSTLINFALNTETGPCGFLTLLPALAEEPQNISVVHARRQGHQWPEVYAFIGDTELTNNQDGTPQWTRMIFETITEDILW